MDFRLFVAVGFVPKRNETLKGGGNVREWRDVREERLVGTFGRDHAVGDGRVCDFWPVIDKVRVRPALWI